jgi:hypothetical protein
MWDPQHLTGLLPFTSSWLYNVDAVPDWRAWAYGAPTRFWKGTSGLESTSQTAGEFRRRLGKHLK